jgi:hypothetical protein
MSLKTIIVRWEGPHTFESIESSDLGNGLYFLSGRRRYERSDQIQYFGITTRDKYRDSIKYDHQALGHIREDTLRIWLGQIEYPRRFNVDHLKLAEACLIYFWQPNLNRIGKLWPSKPVCLVSRWTKLDGSVRKKRESVYKELRDVLWWDSEYWRTGNLTLWQD